MKWQKNPTKSFVCWIMRLDVSAEITKDEFYGISIGKIASCLMVS